MILFIPFLAEIFSTARSTEETKSTSLLLLLMFIGNTNVDRNSVISVVLLPWMFLMESTSWLLISILPFRVTISSGKKVALLPNIDLKENWWKLDSILCAGVGICFGLLKWKSEFRGVQHFELDIDYRF